MKTLNLYNIPEISEMLGYDEKETEDAIFRGDWCGDPIIRITNERVDELIHEVEWHNGKYNTNYNEFVLFDLRKKIKDASLPNEFLISREKEYFVGEEYYI